MITRVKGSVFTSDSNGLYANVEDFDSIQAAIDSGASVVNIPAGSYTLDAQLTGTNVSLKGAGPGATILVWSSGAVSSGVYIEVDTPRISVTVEDLSLHTEQTGVGTALEIKGVGDALTVQAGNRPTAIVRNVRAQGASEAASTNGWAKGIRFESVIDPRVEKCRVDTYFASGSFYAPNSAGVELHEPTSGYGLTVEATSIIRAHYGIHITGQHEGIIIHKSQMVAVGKGVYQEAGGNPQFVLSDSHINFYDEGVHLQEINDFYIHDNSIWVRTDATNLAASSVKIEGCTHGHITNNVFKNNSSAGAILTVFQVSQYAGTSSVANQFKDNLLSIYHVGVNIADAQCFDTDIRNNVFRTTPITDYLQNSGTRTRFSRDLKTTVTLNGNQSIATSTNTLISWGTLEATSPTSSWTIGDPTKITINRTGQYQVTVSTNWAASSAGIRRFLVLRNGTGVTPICGLLTGASPILGTTISTTGPVVTLNAGDELEVRVQQSSGGALDLADNLETYFSVREILD